MTLTPRIRKSPYFDATVRYGATSFMAYNNMYLPLGYDTPENEFWHIVNDVTLWDVAVQRIVEITGPDAFAFTNMLTPRDLTPCRVGQCKYVLITNAEGGIVNDPVLSRLGENHFWLSRADSDLLLWAKGVAVFAGMDVDIREPDASALQIQGPKSRPLVVDLFGDVAEALAYYECTACTLGDIPVVLARTGWSAEIGYEVYLRDASRGDELWETIMAAGRPYGIAPASPSRIRRIEAGILDYRVDMDTDTNPYEIGLGRLVKLDVDTDFIGKDALARIASTGAGRLLAGVVVDGEPIRDTNQYRWPVRRDGTRVGVLTSLVYTPRLEKNIGYVMVETSSSALETRLVVETPDGERAATVVHKPFVDAGKVLPRRG